MIEYHNVGALVMKTGSNDYLRPTMALMDQLDSPYSELSPQEITSKLPVWNTESFFPVKRPDDPQFGVANDEALSGGVLFHAAGYISDPQLATHNIMRAAEQAGGEFRYNAEVNGIQRGDGRVSGGSLASGEILNAPVVLNAAGPHSSKINQLADVEKSMAVKTRALRQEVAHVPLPTVVHVPALNVSVGGAPAAIGSLKSTVTS